MPLQVAGRLAGALVLVAAATAHAQTAPAAPASSVAPAPATAASVEAGRALFQAHCVRCHGTDAAGTADAPNLLPRVKGMSEAAFSSAVLQRYRWTVPAAEGAGESAALDAMLRGVLQRQDGAGMPAWESQPAVAQGVKQLYDYLSSKAR